MPDRKISPTYAAAISPNAAMPSGYGLLPVSPPTTGPTPRPISRMITTSGSPRKMSVYTRAGQRSHRDREMPATASAMPSTKPITAAQTVRIKVFGSPVLNKSGIACLYSSQLRNESFSCDMVDFGAAPPAAGFCWFCAAIAAKSGNCGAGAAFDPGFHPGGNARGTQSEYSRAQVPSAMIASSPEFSALINGLFSAAIAQATKLSKLNVFSMICAGSPGCTVPDACCDGATHASIWRVLRLA